MIEKEIGLT